MRAMLRSLTLFGLFALLAWHAPAPAQDTADDILQLLEDSQRVKRGVVLYVNGVTLGGGVVRIEKNQFVELRSPEFGRLVVRIDKIDAAGLR